MLPRRRSSLQRPARQSLGFLPSPGAGPRSSGHAPRSPEERLLPSRSPVAAGSRSGPGARPQPPARVATGTGTGRGSLGRLTQPIATPPRDAAKEHSSNGPSPQHGRSLRAAAAAGLGERAPLPRAPRRDSALPAATPLDSAASSRHALDDVPPAPRGGRGEHASAQRAGSRVLPFPAQPDRTAAATATTIPYTAAATSPKANGCPTTPVVAPVHAPTQSTPAAAKSKAADAVPARNGTRDRTRGDSGGVDVLRRGPIGSPRNVCGLVNVGNTCFMNSSLQGLAHVPALALPLSRGVTAADVCPRSPLKGRLARAMAALIKRMTGAGPGTVERPTEVKSTVGALARRFLQFDQQDAQEFLRFAVDGLHEDLNRVRVAPAYEEIEEEEGESEAHCADKWWLNYQGRNDSLVKDVFAGQLRSRVTCGVCGRVSTAFDPFWDLSLPIPGRVQARQRTFARRGIAAPSSSSSCGGGGGCSLDDCLRAFTAPEQLSANEVYCSRCQRHTPCEKQLCVYRWPRALVLHLKRFAFSTYRRNKLNTAVCFPERGLALAPYTSDDGACESVWGCVCEREREGECVCVCVRVCITVLVCVRALA